MSSTLFGALGRALSDFFAPLTDAVEDPQLLAYLLDELGSSPDEQAIAKLVSTLKPITNFAQTIETMAGKPSPTPADIASLLALGRQAFQAIEELDTSPDLTSAFGGIGKDLLDLLISTYLARQLPLTYRVLVLLAVIEGPDEVTPTTPVTIGGATVRRPVLLPRFHPERLIALVRSPIEFLKSQYLNTLQTDADATAMADKLFPRFASILTLLDIPNKYGLLPEEKILLGDAAAYMASSLTIYVAEQLGGAAFDAGVNFAISPAARGNLGLVISPFGAVQYSDQIGNLALELDLTANIDALAIGHHGAIIVANAATTSAQGKFTVALASPSTTEGSDSDTTSATSAENRPTFVFGTQGGTRLELSGARAEAALSIANGDFEANLFAEVPSAVFVLAAGDGDSFLKSTLPSNDLNVEFNLGISWSNMGGLAFHGAGGLDAALPIRLSLANAVRIPTLYLAVRAIDGELVAESSVAVSVDIGPIAVTIDRVGVAAVATFPPSGGNLGVADFDFHFQPPSGAGLAVDVAGLNGGGFLGHDSAKQEYAGLLDLTFHSYKLTAFGLIATVLPTGPGYSIVAMIDAEFPPIQLGLGFMLTGAGGLLGVNRRADTDALRAALNAHTLSNLLFPKNPIANAPQLLTELDTLFPAAAGRFLFGPLAHIEWGVPAVLTVDLALVLELPDPARLVVIAELAVTLPTPKEKLVEIHVSALGTIDFGACTGALDAVLHDSHLMSFTLHGAMALRVAWAGQKSLVLAIGGVHPKFQPPPGFPRLERVGISMPSGHITKLNLDGYLAVTTNTLQIGAHVDLFVGVDGFGIAGYLNFDTLIQRHPFHFDGDISGGVTLSAGGHDVMALKLDGTLSGPGPWHATGSVSFDVLWWTVTKSFSETFGDEAGDAPPEQVDVGALLRAAFGDARNFHAGLQSGVSSLISLKAPAVPETVVLAAPGTALDVRQTVVPLGLTIAQYGGAVPAGDARFDITALVADGSPQPRPPVLDDFAPGQFLTLSDDEKLARPSFESMAAGVALEGSTVFGPPVARSVAYETLFIDTPDGPVREETGVVTPLPLGVLVGVLRDGATARAERGSAKHRYAGPHQMMMPAVLDFVVATTDEYKAAGIGAASGATYSQAKAALAAELTRHPERMGSLQVAPRYETAA